MASMRNWLQDPDVQNGKRAVVVHCKAGKGRSGTIACSYLISEEGWKSEDALKRFTARRMRVGFGEGVSIPSQLRWVKYTDRWTKTGKLYIERQVEILEVHVWGLRDGVKVAVEGYVDQGQTIKTFHVFRKDERIVVDGTADSNEIFSNLAGLKRNKSGAKPRAIMPVGKSTNSNASESINSTPNRSEAVEHTGNEAGGGAVIFCPSSRIVLPTNDINIDFERRNKATYGWTMVTSVAHVWFNAFFEGQNTGLSVEPASSGTFEIQWDAMDGIKGSSKKGTRALDRLAVVWRALDSTSGGLPQIITEPNPGQPVPESKPADWTGAHAEDKTEAKDLGLRVQSPASASVSEANSIKSAKFDEKAADEDNRDDERAGVRPHGPGGEEHIPHSQGAASRPAASEPNLNDSQQGLESSRGDEQHNDAAEGGIKKDGLNAVPGIVGGTKHISTADLPGGRPEHELETATDQMVGAIVKDKDTPMSS